MFGGPKRPLEIQDVPKQGKPTLSGSWLRKDSGRTFKGAFSEGLPKYFFTKHGLNFPEILLERRAALCSASCSQTQCHLERILHCKGVSGGVMARTRGGKAEWCSPLGRFPESFPEVFFETPAPLSVSPALYVRPDNGFSHVRELK